MPPRSATTSEAGQRHIGVDGPLAGRLLAERVYPDGAELPFGANAMRVVEEEFAFRMGRTKPEALARAGTVLATGETDEDTADRDTSDEAPRESIDDADGAAEPTGAAR